MCGILALIAVLLMSAILVLCSLFVPTRINGPIPVGFTVAFGYPLKFVWQDNIYNPPYASYWYHFDSPLASPTRISGKKFMLDVALVFMSVCLLGGVLLCWARRGRQ